MDDCTGTYKIFGLVLGSFRGDRLKITIATFSDLLSSGYVFSVRGLKLERLSAESRSDVLDEGLARSKTESQAFLISWKIEYEQAT